MILKANKEKLKKNLKNKDKIVLKSGIIFFGISLSTSFITSTLNYFNNLETVVSVTEDVKNSIYNDNYFLDLNDELNNNYEDTNITDASLNKIHSLRINMLKNYDLKVIENCNNIEYIYIENAQELEQKDIDCLYSSNVSKIRLYFNPQEMLKYCSKKLNLNELKDKDVSIYYNELYDYSEIDNIVLLNYVEAPQEMFKTSKYNDYKEIDKKLDEIILKLKINNNDTEYDKIIKITKYIIDHITYDKSISRYMDNGMKCGSEQEEIAKYNYHSLSSVLHDNSEGICINYSSLFNALCYKLGIESYTVGGNIKDSDYAHSWNIYNYDGEYKLIDLTSIDNTPDCKLYLDTYSQNKEKYKDSILKFIAKDINQEKYIYEDNIDDYLSKKNKNIKMYNEIIEGEKVNNQEDNIYIPILFGSINGILAIYFEKNKTKKLIK